MKQSEENLALSLHFVQDDAKIRRLFLFFVDVLKFVREDLFREGSVLGFRNAVGAKGLEHPTRMMSPPHGHTSSARDLKNGVVALAQHLDQSFNLAGASSHLKHDRLRCE